MFRIPSIDPNANPIGDALKFVAALKQQRQQQAYQKQQSDIQQQQFDKNYELQKKAAARADQLFNLQKTEYEDKHKKAMSDEEIRQAQQKAYAQAMAEATGQNNNQIIQPLNTNISIIPNNNIMGLGSTTSQNTINDLMNGQQSNQNTNNQINPMVQTQQINGQGQLINTPENQSLSYNNGNKNYNSVNPNMITRDMIPSSGEIVIKPADPNQIRMNYANGVKPGSKQVSYDNEKGLIYTRDPYSGKITAIKNPAWTPSVKNETSEQRQNREINTKVGAATAIANIKDEAEAKNFGKTLINQAINNADLYKLLESEPGSTGPYQAAKKYLKQGTKEYAEFNRLATPLMAPLVNQLSPKRSVYALQLAQSGKFDPTQPYEYNVGILGPNTKEIIDTYDNEKKDYEERYHKPYPYKLPKIYDVLRKKFGEQSENDQSKNVPAGMVPMYKNGIKHLIPQSQSEDANKNWGYTYAK